jgi:hypothetical protein
MRKDSIGNELPKSKWVSNPNELGEALATNTFLLACEIALSKNKIVIYDKETKSATITDENGLVSFVSHSA